VEGHATDEAAPRKRRKKARAALRREGKMRVALTARYDGDELTSAILVLEDQTMRPDVINRTTGRLYEIKSTMDVRSIQTALGQLAMMQALYLEQFGVFLQKVIVLPMVPGRVLRNILATEAVEYEVVS
jgi:hypothetical protein